MTTSSEVESPQEAPPRTRLARSKAARSALSWLLGRPYAQPAIVAAGVLLLGIAYYLQARTIVTTSEGGSQALQGWDMLHGNPLLKGWSLSDVSFYTTELPEYALVELVRGLNTWTVPTAAALSYFLQVVMAGFLAKGRATGRDGWVRALIAVGIMLAPPLGAPTALLMGSPDHAGTHVPLLLIFLVLDRVRPRWWLPIVIMVMLTWAAVADPLVIYEGALPIAAVCAVRMYRRRGPWPGQWYDLSLVVAAVASVGVARVILKVIEDAGGFYVRTPIAAFAAPGDVSRLFWTKIGNFLLLFGADFFGEVFGRSAVVALLHLIGIAFVLWAVAAVIRHFYVEHDQIAQMLTVAFVVVLAAYLFGVKPDANEIVGLLPIGAVLAGRVLGGTVNRAGLVPVFAVVFVIFAVFLGANATWPSQTNPSQERVASWLEQHGYSYGLAAYWNATAVTVETAGQIKVRPVRTYQAEVVWTNFQTDSAWYDPGKNNANFVIWHPKKSCGDFCLTSAGLQSAFGKPVRVVRIGQYLVLLYNRNLLTAVPEFTWCGNLWPWTAHVAPVPTTNLHCTGISGSALIPK